MGFLPCSVTSTTLHFTILQRLSSPPPFAPPLPRAVLCPLPRPSLARAPSARAVVPLRSPPQSRHTLRGLVLSWWSLGARAPYAIARRQARVCAFHFLRASFHVPSPVPLFTSPFF